MATDKSILLRIQSPEGTKRIQISVSETTSKLYEIVHSTFNLNSFEFSLHKLRNQKDEISSSRSQTIRNVGLCHGDMVYLTPINGCVLFPQSSNQSTPMMEEVPRDDEPRPSSSSTRQSVGSARTSINTAKFSSSAGIPEDEVDLQLSKLDGKIERKRDEKLCRHNANSRCVHCSSLEPYDEGYLKDQNIKHLSFHSFIRKLTSGVDKGKFLALEDISCRIKNGCEDHPPWPRGICSKCQPNTITLSRQDYRHVDNVVFENTKVVEGFLNYWRTTGHQRIGFLYGFYEIHTDVPLGIKAKVVAIYEPPQESGNDYVQLLPDDKEELVEYLAGGLGLRKVGWIFTDLTAQDLQKGTLKHTRNISTYLLSAQECITAGHYQNLHPNSCKYASTGYFGSKFVTVCVTGDKDNQVHMEGYQVSNQCMALVRDNCLVPTKDIAELGYVRESSNKQYVPDVYYKEKDSYGNEISRLARPLPVEYLLLDVPASTPVTPQYTFNTDPSKQVFPIENRLVDGFIQDFNALTHYLSQFSPDEFLAAMSDFHLLIYIASMDVLPMRDFIALLLDAIKNKDLAKALEWSQSEQWTTVEQLIAANNTSPPPSSLGNHASNPQGAQEGNQWTCAFCTFLNSSSVQNCEMCNLPRNMPH